MDTILGIDLGTTNSEVAVIIDGNARIIEDGDGGIMPSCVGISNDGKLIVGIEARNQAVAVPERTVLSIKRLMGTNRRITMGDSDYLPHEISAFILKSLKTRAEKELGGSIEKAVITVPAYFTDAQRHATREAGQLAGLDVVRIINEPTAAALAYESARSETRRILIFDLGGGTFDVSIVKIENGVVEVLASTGDNHLGGDDFDKKIADRLAEHCEKELGLAVKDDPNAMARLARASESAKIRLSSEPFVIVEEDHIGKVKNEDVHLSFELSRTDFEEMIEDDLARTRDSINKALKDANLLAPDIDKIILVGGSTRIPAISDMLEKKFGKMPHGEIDPDLCVAIGAGIQAGREMGLESSSVLLDITPYTLGTSAVGDLDGDMCMTRFVPLIRRNTKLPACRTEAFSTFHDFQEIAEISVYQGEEANALDNIRIGNYKFELTKAPRGSIILLNYDLDLNGILKIEAVEKKTGRKINAVIENAFSELSEEELAESRKRISMMWDDDDESALAGAETAEQSEPADTGIPADLADVLKQAEEKLGEVPDEDRDEMVNLMEEIKESIRDGDLETAERLREGLEDILFYLE